MKTRFCGITGTLGEAPFGAATLIDVPASHGRHSRDALALVGSGGGPWKLEEHHAYLPMYSASTAGPRRIASLSPVPPRVVRSFEGRIRDLPLDLTASLGILEVGVSSSADRAWVEVDWHGLLYPRPALTRGELDPNALFDELLSLLQRLARHGAVHGGIEPGHIRRRSGENAARRGALCLAHFGLPPLLAAQRVRVFSALGTSIGDPRYMAPEVAFGLEPGPEADWYSAAASFIDLLSSPLGAPTDSLLGLPGARARAERSPEEWLSMMEEGFRQRLEGRVLEQLWWMLEPHPSHRRLNGVEPVRERAPHRVGGGAVAARDASVAREVEPRREPTASSEGSERKGDTNRSLRPVKLSIVAAALLSLLVIGVYLAVSSPRGRSGASAEPAPGDPTGTLAGPPLEVEEPVVFGPPAPEPCDLNVAVAVARHALAFGIAPSAAGGQGPAQLAPIACVRAPVAPSAATPAKSEELGCCEAVVALRRCAEEHDVRPLMTYRLPEGPLAKQRVAQLREELRRCGMESSLVPLDVSGMDVITAPAIPPPGRPR